VFAENLAESKHQVIGLEESSSYPNYSILLIKGQLDSFKCHLEIPSKRDSIFRFRPSVDEIRVRRETYSEDYDFYRCVVDYPQGRWNYPKYSDYNLTYVAYDNNNSVIRNFGTFNTSKQSLIFIRTFN